MGKKNSPDSLATTMKPPAPVRILCQIYLFLASVWALNPVDANFAPVIRGPGTTLDLVWHPGTSML